LQVDAAWAVVQAALLEEKPDAFECSLGRLAPKSFVEVTLKYVQQLSFYSSNEMAFVLPHLVAPFRDTPSTPKSPGPNWSCEHCPFADNRWSFPRCAVCGVRRPLTAEEEKRALEDKLQPAPTKVCLERAADKPF
jgi:hypothetical protein